MSLRDPPPPPSLESCFPWVWPPGDGVQCVLPCCSVIVVEKRRGAQQCSSLLTSLGTSVFKAWEWVWGLGKGQWAQDFSLTHWVFLLFLHSRATLGAPWCAGESFRVWCPGGLWSLVGKKASQGSTPIFANMWTGSGWS